MILRATRRQCKEETVESELHRLPSRLPGGSEKGEVIAEEEGLFGLVRSVGVTARNRDDHVDDGRGMISVSRCDTPHNYLLI